MQWLQVVGGKWNRKVQDPSISKHTQARTTEQNLESVYDGSSVILH
jgi:hypothetical protein